KKRRVQLVMPVTKPNARRTQTTRRRRRAALPGLPVRPCFAMAHLSQATKVSKTVHPVSAAKFPRLQFPTENLRACLRTRRVFRNDGIPPLERLCQARHSRWEPHLGYGQGD